MYTGNVCVKAWEFFIIMLKHILFINALVFISNEYFSKYIIIMLLLSCLTKLVIMF